MKGKNRTKKYSCSNILTEIWTRIGLFTSKPSLYALVRVSRWFRTIFLPLLYESHTLGLTGRQFANQKIPHIERSNLELIKNFEVVLDIRPEAKSSFIKSSELYVSWLIYLMEQMTQLRSIR